MVFGGGEGGIIVCRVEKWWRVKSGEVMDGVCGGEMEGRRRRVSQRRIRKKSGSAEVWCWTRSDE